MSENISVSAYRRIQKRIGGDIPPCVACSDERIRECATSDRPAISVEVQYALPPTLNRKKNGEDTIVEQVKFFPKDPGVEKVIKRWLSKFPVDRKVTRDNDAILVKQCGKFNRYERKKC